MYCPNCKCEYLDGILTCVDCNIPLVFELFEETEPVAEDSLAEFENLVEIKTYATYHEAQLVEGFLTANGIFAKVPSASTGGFKRLSYGIQLFIREEDINEAKALLAEVGDSLFENDMTGGSDDPLTLEKEDEKNLLYRNMVIGFGLGLLILMILYC